MTFLKKLYLGLFLAINLGTAPALSSPRVHNTTPAFAAFWEIAKDLSLEEQIALFETMVVPTFPEFYEFKFKDWEEAGCSKQEELQKVFTTYKTIHEKFSAQATSLEKDFEVNLQTFMQAFPSCSTDFEIYITHSLGSMAGGTRKINEKEYKIFGLDVIITHLSGIPTTPFFHHELLHFHHGMSGFKETDDFWVNLWSEGLATYVSDALNPGSSQQEIFIGTPIEDCKTNLPFLWNDCEKSLETTDRKTYNKYFMLPAGSDKRIPACAGYYLGYLIAKELGQTYSLDELVKMDAQTVHQHITRIVGRHIKSSAPSAEEKIDETNQIYEK